jgi:hypothetical protein
MGFCVACLLHEATRMAARRHVFELGVVVLGALAAACGSTGPTATTVTYAAGEIAVQRPQAADTRPLVLYISERTSDRSTIAFECHLFATTPVTSCGLAATLRIGVDYAVAVFIDDQQSPRESAVGVITIRGAGVSRQGSECAIMNTFPCWPVGLFTIVNAEGTIR